MVTFIVSLFLSSVIALQNTRFSYILIESNRSEVKLENGLHSLQLCWGFSSLDIFLVCLTVCNLTTLKFNWKIYFCIFCWLKYDYINPSWVYFFYILTFISFIIPSVKLFIKYKTKKHLKDTPRIYLIN